MLSRFARAVRLANPKGITIRIFQLIEMTKGDDWMGRDGLGLYFDEFPSSPTGDWNPACREQFAQRFGHEMPDQPTSEVLAFNQAMTEEYYQELLSAIGRAASHAAALVSITFAPALDNHGWVNYTSTCEAGYGQQDVAKVEWAKGLVAKPVSAKPHNRTNSSCDSGWSPPIAGRSPGSTVTSTNASSYGACQDACCANSACQAVIFYAQTRPNNNCHLLPRTYNSELQCLPGAATPIVANRRGAGVPPSVCPAAAPAVPGAPIEPDVLLSWAWALGRGASDGQPPHTWIPWLRTADQAACASSALRAYGHVSNPDHTEKDIPNKELYGQLYQTAKTLDDELQGEWPLPPARVGFGTPVPVRFAAVVHSERARNDIYASPHQPRGTASPQALAEAWKRLLYPAAGLWAALVRSGVPAAVIPEWLLERHAAEARFDFPVLLAPAVGALQPNTEAALREAERAGRTVIRAAVGDDWEDPASRARLGQAALSKAIAKAGKPRVSFAPGSMGTSAHPWHVVAYDAASTKDRTISKALFIHVLNDFAWCAGEEKVLVPPPAPPPVSGLRIAVRDCVGATAKDVLTGNAVALSRNGTACELALPTFDQFLVVLLSFK